MKLAFLFIGGEHQVLHLAPVAARVSELRKDIAIDCICSDVRTAQALRDVALAMKAKGMNVVEVSMPWASKAARALTGLRSAMKQPLLAKIRWVVRDAQAIIVPERSSASLRWLGWRRSLIHFRHGAGDRAPSSERRLWAFDAILVAGEKDVERAVAQNIDAARLSAIGYVKMDYLRSVQTNERLFDNDRPIVVYNPHFDRSISSIGMARDVLCCFAGQTKYNIVFAPHIRWSETLTDAVRAEWQALEIPGKIIVDLGSSRLFDMTYVRAASVYLGDMSSQLYEFLSRPRPAAFLNAHATNWQHDPRYSGWRLGVVASNAIGVLPAIDQAIASHADVALRQSEAVALAFGDYHGSIGQAAKRLLELVSPPRSVAAE